MKSHIVSYLFCQQIGYRQITKFDIYWFRFLYIGDIIMIIEEKEYKGIFYNIYNGGGHRCDEIAKFIRRKDYSFAAFSELNNFTMKSFEEWGAKKLELKYAEFLETPHGFHLGIASRHKLHLIKKNVDSPMHHGYILVWIEYLDLYVLVTHLCPTTALQRLDEAKHIVNELLSLDLAKKSLMIVGDLNTLSSRDNLSNDAFKLLASNPNLKAKFLRDDQEGHLSVDFRPMDCLLQELVDIGNPNDYSVPTKIIEDKMHATQMRLDYCLVSKALLNAGKERMHSKTIRSGETDELSDHYPLEITFNISK